VANNKLFKDLLELLSLLEARAMVQPSRVDFDVRKVLKRKKVSRDWMAFSEHGEFCIKRSSLEPTFVFVRLFPAKMTSLLRTSRTAPHYFE
jgi:hypothetical protein